jgi:hypothetical protein
MIPRTALEQEANIFYFGAKKYGRDNYKNGMKWTRLVDACLRHVIAFADGENTDPESGQSHLAHARCCLAMLLYYENKQVGEDDRLPKEENK